MGRLKFNSELLTSLDSWGAVWTNVNDLWTDRNQLWTNGTISIKLRTPHQLGLMEAIFELLGTNPGPLGRFQLSSELLSIREASVVMTKVENACKTMAQCAVGYDVEIGE